MTISTYVCVKILVPGKISTLVSLLLCYSKTTWTTTRLMGLGFSVYRKGNLHISHFDALLPLGI